MDVAARDEDDLPATALLDHVSRYELAHVEPAGQGSFDYLRKRGRIKVDEIGALLIRRVTDEDVDPAQGVNRAL